VKTARGLQCQARLCNNSSLLKWGKHILRSRKGVGAPPYSRVSLYPRVSPYSSQAFMVAPGLPCSFASFAPPPRLNLNIHIHILNPSKSAISPPHPPILLWLLHFRMVLCNEAFPLHLSASWNFFCQRAVYKLCNRHIKAFLQSACLSSSPLLSWQLA
jgi:hypothetical protein